MRFTPLRLIAFLLVVSLVPPNLHRPAPLRHQLNATLPEVKFDGVSLADAIDFLRDVSGANIIVNWKALEGEGCEQRRDDQRQAPFHLTAPRPGHHPRRDRRHRNRSDSLTKRT